MRKLLIVFSVFFSASLALASPITSIVVYGDSLSDNGNLYSAIGYPPSPYYNGRFSNGPVSVENLAAHLQVSLLDYAYGGATTGLGGSGDGGNVSKLVQLPGLTTQFNLTKGSLGPLVQNSLFIVWGGPNDFLSPSPMDSVPAGVIQHGVSDLVSIVSGLQALGAQNILVPGMPDLGLTPQYVAQGQVAAQQASAISMAFNTLLIASLPKNAIYVDTFGLLHQVVSNPSAYGLTNVTNACFNGITLCSNPNQYLFFDDRHPSETGQQILAQSFAAAVPEPSTSLFLLSALLMGSAKQVTKKYRN